MRLPDLSMPNPSLTGGTPTAMGLIVGILVCDAGWLMGGLGELLWLVGLHLLVLMGKDYNLDCPSVVLGNS